jgi:hypothetical protein
MTLTAAEKNAFNETALATLSVTFTATPSATATATWTVSPSPSMTPSRTATHTQTPSRTPTRTMTRTPTPKVFTRSLDMPIGREKKFIIHRVGLGENLQQYAEVHRTSADAIIRVNYSLFVPLWVDALVVIPVGFTDVEMIPYFEPYQVQANNLSLETLAGELGTNLQDFKFYNNFKEGEMVYRGDWVLVPRLKNAAGQLYFND